MRYISIEYPMILRTGKDITMTQEQYRKLHCQTEYIGKHEKKEEYIVWRVLGPAGPIDRIKVSGIHNVREAILGCYDWEVTRADTGELLHI